MTPPQPGGPTHKFLSDALVARGFVSQAAMDQALHASRAGRRYSEILVANGAISEDDLARTLADHHRIDHVDLDVFPIDLNATALVSPETARRLGALPVGLLSTGEVVVALYDPEALTNMVELAELIGREIRPVVASRSQVEQHISSAPARRPAHAEPPHDAAPQPAPSEPAAASPAQPAPPAPAPVAIVPELTERLLSAEQRAHEADERAQIAEERARMAERAWALAQYRDDQAAATAAMPAHAPAAVQSEQSWAPPGMASQTVPPDRAQQADAAGVEAPVAAVGALEQRLDAAERRVAEADERAAKADERAAAAEERASTAEEHARFADERAVAAEKHAEGMAAAAHAANEALAQLAQARLISDQTARASVREIESLSNELDGERAERRRLEQELQRRLADDRASVHVLHPPAELYVPPPAAPPAPPAAPVAAYAPEPPPAMPTAAPGPPPSAAPPGAVEKPDTARKVRGLRRMIAALKRT